MTSDLYERQAREALRELRSIAQPLNGSDDAAVLRSYAKAAAARISAMGEPEGEILAVYNTEGSGAYGSSMAQNLAERSAMHFNSRGIRCAVVKEPGGFVVREDL